KPRAFTAGPSCRRFSGPRISAILWRRCRPGDVDGIAIVEVSWFASLAPSRLRLIARRRIRVRTDLALAVAVERPRGQRRPAPLDDRAAQKASEGGGVDRQRTE